MSDMERRDRHQESLHQALFRSSALRLALVIMSLAWATVLPAQEAPPLQPPEVDTVESEATVVMPAAEISLRATEDGNRLRQFRDQLQPDQDVMVVQETLLETIDDLRQLSTEPELADLESLNLAAFARLRDSRQPYRERFETWQLTVQDRAQTLEETAGELRDMQEVWNQALASAAEQELPETVVDRITTLLAEIAAVGEERQARMDELLTLQDRLQRELADVDAVLDRIDDAGSRSRHERFTFDGDPLWTALQLQETYVSPGLDIVEVWNLRSEDLTSFWQENRYRVRFQIGICGALVLLILLLKRSRRSESDDDSLNPAVRVLSRPISAALVLVIFASRWIYPDLNESVVSFLMLLALVPAIRLLSRLITAASRANSYGIIVLFVLDWLAGLTLEQTLLHRLLLLAVTLLACALLASATRRGRAATAQRGGGWLRLAILAGRLAIVLLFASALVNIIGMVALSRLLTTATLSSVYLAVLLLAAVLVITGIMELALRSRATGFARIIGVHAADIRKYGSILIPLAAFFFWARITLKLLDIYQPLVSGFSAALARPWVFGTFEISLGDLLAFLITLGITFLASRFIPAVLQKDVLARTKMPYGARGAVALIVRYGILFIGILIAIATAGIQLSQFALIAGALGVGIGFGLQNIVSNFISGTVLAFERPISIGDTIQVGTLYGIVQRIGLRTSVVRALDGSEVILPNSTLTSVEVINWTLSDHRRRLEIKVGTAYGTDPHVVIELLERVAKEHPKIRAHPEPRALFLGFGESSLDFLLWCWMSDPERWHIVRSQVTLSVHDALREAGIVIPFPQRDLHLRTVDEKSRSLLGGRQDDQSPDS